MRYRYYWRKFKNLIFVDLWIIRPSKHDYECVGNLTFQDPVEFELFKASVDMLPNHYFIKHNGDYDPDKELVK